MHSIFMDWNSSPNCLVNLSYNYAMYYCYFDKGEVYSNVMIPVLEFNYILRSLYNAHNHIDL